VSKGLGDLYAGFTSVEDPGGYAAVLSTVQGFPVPPSSGSKSGVVEGLTLIRLGLDDPSGVPGVSDGLGLVRDGIQGDVLGGLGKLKDGIAAKVIPGLEEMNVGIQDELQPGFSKVSMLLLAIWLVSLVIFLVVGILIGRGRKAKASAGASM
jgi:hypothetical protein